MEEISRISRSKTQAKASYDAMSGWYDWLAGASEKSYREECLRWLDIHLGETVLEIGFGTGNALPALARSVGSSGKVYGIDLSEGMYRRARSRLMKAGLADRVELRSGDATALPFPSGSMDAVFIAFTLELFDTPEIPIVVGECRRVLRRGGRIGVVVMAKPDKPNRMVRMYEWAHRTFPAWADCRPIRAELFLEDGGFVILNRVKRSMWGLPVEIILSKA